MQPCALVCHPRNSSLASYTTIPLCDHPFLPFHAHRTSPQANQTLTAMAQKAGA